MCKWEWMWKERQVLYLIAALASSRGLQPFWQRVITVIVGCFAGRGRPWTRWFRLTTKILIHGIPCPGRDLNQSPPEYKSEKLRLRPACSNMCCVCCILKRTFEILVQLGRH
jgi:hypothetical protein